MLAHDKEFLNVTGGQRPKSEPAGESEHFAVCGDCGQAFDLRSFFQVAHHDEPGHQPLTEAEMAARR